MMQDKALTLTYTQIGGLTSILPVCYGKALLPTQTCVSHNAYTLLSTSQELLFGKKCLVCKLKKACVALIGSEHIFATVLWFLAIHTGQTSRGFETCLGNSQAVYASKLHSLMYPMMAACAKHGCCNCFASSVDACRCQ